MAHRVLIVGGGFAGVCAARALAKKKLPDVRITLLTDRPWLEYYGVLYRVIRDGPLAQACMPLKMLLQEEIEVVIDRAVSVDASAKTVAGAGGGTHAYDTLVLAPGSEPAYFGIPGMKEHAWPMMSAHHALRVKDAIPERIAAMKAAGTEGERRRLGRFVVIGAGATGVETSPDLLLEAREQAAKAGLDPSLVRVDLIEAADRVLPLVEPKASAKTLARLRKLGVDVHLNTAVASAAEGSITLKDGTVIDAATILWTAGLKASSLLETVAGMERDKRGRAVVDGRLRAKGIADVFVTGDCASTKFAGMAQTAIDDGVFVANVFAAERTGRSVPAYDPAPPAYAIPAGPWWAAVKYLFVRAYGYPGYVLRRLADIHVYMLVMPWRYVFWSYTGTTPMKKYGVTVR
jgi:NADH dehydrogenase